MITAPVGIIFIVVVTWGFMALFLVDSPFTIEEQTVTTEDIENTDSKTFGFLDAVGGAIRFVSTATLFLWDLLSFNVPGAPPFVRFLVATTLDGSLVWSIASLIRGGH